MVIITKAYRLSLTKEFIPKHKPKTKQPIKNIGDIVRRKYSEILNSSTSLIAGFIL